MVVESRPFDNIQWHHVYIEVGEYCGLVKINFGSNINLSRVRRYTDVPRTRIVVPMIKVFK